MRPRPSQASASGTRSLLSIHRTRLTVAENLILSMNNFAKIALMGCFGASAVAGHGTATADSVGVVITSPVYTEWVGAPPGTATEFMNCAPGEASSRLIGFTVRYAGKAVHHLRARCVTMAANGNWDGSVTEYGALLTTSAGTSKPLKTSSIDQTCPRDHFVSGLRLYVGPGRIISHVQPYCSRYASDASGQVFATQRPQPLPIRGMPSGGNWTPPVLCPSHKPIGYGAQQSLTETELRRVRLSCL